MLNIYFGDMPEAVYNTSVYFNYTYEDEWLTSDFAKEVIKKIGAISQQTPTLMSMPKSMLFWIIHSPPEHCPIRKIPSNILYLML